MPYPHKDTPESFWERMRMIHGEDVEPERRKGGLVQQEIKASQDDHVFIVIRQDDRPVVSLDINNNHGRRGLGIRLDGMSVASFLLDLKEIGPGGDGSRLQRFCPYCGMPSVLTSSFNRHKCEPEESWRADLVKYGDRLAGLSPTTPEAEGWWETRRKGT